MKLNTLHFILDIPYKVWYNTRIGMGWDNGLSSGSRLVPVGPITFRASQEIEPLEGDGRSYALVFALRGFKQPLAAGEGLSISVSENTTLYLTSSGADPHYVASRRV